MVPSDAWESIKKRMGKEGVLREKEFYTNNKYALWIDLRTFTDNEAHGGGLQLNNTRMV